MENHAPHHRRTDSDNDFARQREYMERFLSTSDDTKDVVSQSSRLPPSGRPSPSLYESSSIQRLDILKEFPWLNEGLEQHSPRLSTQRQVSATSRALLEMQYGASNSTCTVPSGEGSSLRFFKEEVQQEENASLRLSVTESPTNPTPECFTEPPSDAPLLAWAQFMLDSQALQSTPPYDPSLGDDNRLVSTQLFSDQMGQRVGSNSVTPINSESLSSSISDDEAQLKFKDEADGVGTSVESGKRKTPEREEGGDEKTDKSEAKKKQPINRPRKKGGIKRVREPRYAIKTRTEVDVMDDGYKWRKYGQKAVKNSPHPRNYYRCTTAKCPVRKRVERSFADPAMVVTTYEGTHTHQTPALMNRTPGPAGYLDTSGGLFPPSLGVGTPTLRPFSQDNLMSLPNLSNLYQFRGPQWLLPHQQVSSSQENLNWRRAIREDPVFRTSIKSEPIQTFITPNPEILLATPQSTNLLSSNLIVSPQSQAFGPSGSDAPLSSAYQILGVDSYNLNQQNRESLRSRQFVDLQAAASAEIRNFGRSPLDYTSSIGEPTFDRDTYARQSFVRRRQDQETRNQLARVQSQEIVVPTDEDVAENLLSRRPP